MEQSKKRILEQVRDQLRVQHYSIRTEKTYLDWIRRYIHFHKFVRREQLDEEPESRLELFLTHLAVEKNVALSTQNQATNAIVYPTFLHLCSPGVSSLHEH